jgi:hypothetical protein
MPCKGGYRKSIEERKRQIREERERAITDPYRRLWLWLVEQVHHSFAGFDGLSHPLKLYFAVGLLELEIYNGGFHQYFFSDSGSYYVYAEEGLIAVGAFQTLELLQKAKEVLFPDRSVPVKTGIRRRELPSYPPGNLPMPKWSKVLDDLNKRYWADAEGITLRLESFARDHGLVSNAR